MTDRQPEQQPTQTEKKATITLDSANSDPKYPAYQLSLNAMDGEHSGHGYRLMGPKYIGRSRNLRTTELTQRDADEIRAILDEVFPPKAVDESELARRVQCGDCGAVGTVDTGEDGRPYLYPSGQIGH